MGNPILSSTVPQQPSQSQRQREFDFARECIPLAVREHGMRDAHHRPLVGRRYRRRNEDRDPWLLPLVRALRTADAKGVESAPSDAARVQGAPGASQGRDDGRGR